MSSKTLDQIRKEVYRKPQTYSLPINRDQDIDVEARTVKLAFASDKPIDNWWYGQVRLMMGKKNIRTERLDQGIPLLDSHDSTKQIGIVEEYSFDTDGIARCVARFSQNEEGEKVFRDVRDGIKKGVSVGFMIWELNLESKSKDKPSVYRADDWEPYEVSIVAVPADISVGVGRSMDTEPDAADPAEICPDCGMPMDDCECADPETVSQSLAATRAISLKEENKMKTAEEIAAENAAREQRSAETAARRTEIVAFADIYGEGDLARSMMLASDEVTVDDIRVAIRDKRAASTQTLTPPPMAAADQALREGGVRTELARIIPRHAGITSFKGERAEEKAYRFGQWLLGRALFDGNFAPCLAARKYCEEQGLTRAMGESVNETGGYTVPPEFSNDLIDLREQYGVFRRNAKVMPMNSDTLTIPRRASGLTAYYVAEAGSITASDMGWDQVNLVAKKLAVLARYSSEVNEDSILDFANTLADEIAYAFANAEDQAGFNGDGTSTYGGITGVRDKLKNLDSTIANISGLFVGAGNAYSELVLTDFEGVVAKLPQYADTDAAAWFVHRSFYWNVMVKLMLAAGGVTAAEIEDARRQRFMGYRVEFSQVMPKAEGNSQVCALLGDLAKAAAFGSRRDTQIMFSEHSRFANDQIEIRGTERFDINVHDVGDVNATVASQNPGPIVGLITAAS